MNNTPEQRRVYEENFDFHDRFRDALVKVVQPLHFLRALDYGSGDTPNPWSWFTYLHPNEEICVYDIKRGFATLSARNNYIARWTNSVSLGSYDIVICHFSLHEMDHDPKHIIRDLRFYNPQFVVVAEYDYASANEDEFQQTFIADQERKELYGVWRGDVAACFRHHARHGIATYKQALFENEYEIAEEARGHGAARYKFFLIGYKS